MKSKLGRRIEELILIIIILFNIFVFFEILPDELYYTKAIISWTVMGYLLYRVSLTKNLFGEKNKAIDALLIISFFLLVLKNLVNLAFVALEKATLFQAFYTQLVSYAPVIEQNSFAIGGLGLIAIALYIAMKIDVKPPSVMHMFRAEGRIPNTVYQIISKWFWVWFVLIAFFIVVFNFIMEWLTLILDSPLLMIGLFSYIWLSTRYKRLKPETFIFKLGQFGERFYEKFLELFHSSKIFLGISGMLVLHLLTDIGGFILPYIFTFQKNILYFGVLGRTTHSSFWYLLSQDINLASGFLSHLSVAGVYLLNLVAMLLLLSLPALVWYYVYKSRHHIPAVLLALFFASIVSFVLAPSFSLSSISDPTFLVGVDITSQSIFQKSVVSITTVFFLSLLVGILVFILEYSHQFKKMVIGSFLVHVGIFFGYYLYLFFTDTVGYYLETIPLLFFLEKFFIMLYIFAFFVITILFYAGGFFIFITETAKVLGKAD